MITIIVKRYIVLGLFLIIFIDKCFSQNICVTATDIPDFLLKNSDINFTQSHLENIGEKDYCFNIYVYIFRRSNGTGGQSVEIVDSILNRLNEDYNAHRISFSLLGFEFLNVANWIYDKPTLLSFAGRDADKDGKFDRLSELNIPSHSNAIDIYVFPKTMHWGGGLAVDIPSTALMMGGTHVENNIATSRVLSHEMGHVLGLYHTFHGTSLEERDMYSCPELVNGSNSSRCGDYVEDTPADPSSNVSNVDPNTCKMKDTIKMSSTHKGIPKDENGDYYSPNMNLIMSYTPPNCMLYHTKGQASRMKMIIEKYLNLKKTLCGSGDLYIRDNLNDDGSVPNYYNPMWTSPDIWIEDMAGNKVDPHGNDVYNVCVRIHNRGDYDSSGKDTLILNWAKAGVDLIWNDSWFGKKLFFCSDRVIPRGGYIGDSRGIVIPSIKPHQSAVIKVSWLVPRREDYMGCHENIDKQLWHFCLLARIHDGYPISQENDNIIGMSGFVRNNNNVAWRNITILEDKFNKSTISVGNPFKELRTFSLSYSLRYNGLDEQLLYNYADVYLNMSSNLFELWQKSDFAGKGFKVVDKNKILLTEPTATIERLVLQPEELYLLEAEVNFFTQEKPENNEFTFDIAEYVDDEKEGKELIGGETYIAIRNPKRDSYFKAKAVDDKTVLPAEPVSFRAEPISEDAVYTWFDQKGDTVAHGLNLTVTPTSTQHYKLEVVATADGFKDYDSVRATVRNGAIVSLSPNPTDNQLTITYRLAAGITNATIEISDVQNLSVQSYPVAATATTKTVSLAGLTAGTYVVKLIINGETVDTQQVIKN